MLRRLPFLLLSAFALAALLAGCATSPGPTLTLADACNSYANALDKLTPLKAAGKLSAAIVAAVDNANALTKPLCSSGTAPSDANSAITLVSGEASEILAIASGAH